MWNLLSQHDCIVLKLVFHLIPYRAEQQRNQALQNAEKLKEAFKDYKATISIKLKRVNSLNSNNFIISFSPFILNRQAYILDKSF